MLEHMSRTGYRMGEHWKDRRQPDEEEVIRRWKGKVEGFRFEIDV